MEMVESIFYLLKGAIDGQSCRFLWRILAGYSATPAAGVWRFGRRRDDHASLHSDTQGVTLNTKSPQTSSNSPGQSLQLASCSALFGKMTWMTRREVEFCTGLDLALRDKFLTAQPPMGAVGHDISTAAAAVRNPLFDLAQHHGTAEMQAWPRAELRLIQELHDPKCLCVWNQESVLRQDHRAFYYQSHLKLSNTSSTCLQDLCAMFVSSHIPYIL